MRKRESIPRHTKDYIRLRDGGICVYCENAVGQQIDHVLPVKHGGRGIRANLVLSCESCNRRKKAHLDEALIAKAFRHLLRVGEDLSWTERG